MKNNISKNPIIKKISQILTIILVGVFIYSAYALIDIGLDYYKNRQLLSEVQKIYDNNETVSKNGDADVSKVRDQFNELQKINPEIIGWINIEDTVIDYPIVQAKDNDYYLSRNYKQENSRAGSIFMDYRNDLNSYNKNTIIYGHRMYDGSMFNQLTKFTDQNYFDTHKKIYFDTLFDSYDAEVFAVYKTTTDFDYIKTEFNSESEYGELLEEIKEKSIFDSDVNVSEEDEIITLSTCDEILDPHEGRLVVHAKVVSKEKNVANNE